MAPNGTRGHRRNHGGVGQIGRESARVAETRFCGDVGPKLDSCDARPQGAGGAHSRPNRGNCA
eukprot:1390133-Alexandrium_andersonii.AAC.1